MNYFSKRWSELRDPAAGWRSKSVVLYWILAVFTFLTILILIIPGLQHSFYNNLYYPYLFPLVRYLLDLLFSSTVFIFGYFFLFLWLFLLFRGLIRLIKRIRAKAKTRASLLKFLGICSAPIVFFYWMWGFNYAREPLSRTLNLQLKAVSVNQLKSEMEYTLDQMVFIRQQMKIGDSSAVSAAYESVPKDTILVHSAPQVLEEFGLKQFSDAPVKSFWPEGLLHRLNTSGFYNPFTGECYKERDLHPIQIPFIKAHEWCHAQGVTDEGDANFLAYWICVSSGDLLYAYSGYMEYWRYLSAEIRKLDPDAYNISRENLPFGIKSDLLEIRENLLKYPEFMPDVRDIVYDSYLKSHGITEGMASYNRLVNMVVATKRQKRL
jgi:hypothetical protein